jgi:hypothetical protein
VDKELVGTGRFELEPNCGRERGKAERESAGEILTLSLSKGPMARGRRISRSRPSQGFYLCGLRYAAPLCLWGARGRLGKRLIADG